MAQTQKARSVQAASAMPPSERRCAVSVLGLLLDRIDSSCQIRRELGFVRRGWTNVRHRSKSSASRTETGDTEANFSQVDWASGMPYLHNQQLAIGISCCFTN